MNIIQKTHNTETKSAEFVPYYQKVERPYSECKKNLPMTKYRRQDYRHNAEIFQTKHRKEFLFQN